MQQEQNHTLGKNLKGLEEEEELGKYNPSRERTNMKFDKAQQQ